MDDVKFDILGIGNAMVDVVAQVDNTFLSRHDMLKGTMILVDAEQADAVYAAMPPGEESSGGSAGNTCAVAAALGARVAYLGKVAMDQLGAVFRHDISAAGVHFPSAPLIGGAPTARCLVLVTPDGQRTMNTYLGACVSFGEDGRGRGAGGGLGDHLSRGLPVRSAGGAGGVPSRRGDGACGGPAGGAVAVGSVLRRSPSRGVPRTGVERRGHPVRQRGRNHRALRREHIRGGGRGGARATSRWPR